MNHPNSPFLKKKFHAPGIPKRYHPGNFFMLYGEGWELDFDLCYLNLEIPVTREELEYWLQRAPQPMKSFAWIQENMNTWQPRQFCGL